MRAGTIALALCALVGCGGGSEAPAEAPEAPPPQATPQKPEPAPTPPSPPAGAPVTGPPDVARGEALYGQYCASCHGPRGAGDGPLAQGLDPRPASHDDGAYMNALSNEHLAKVIREGGPAVGKSPLMAAWGGTLSPAQLRDVIAFVRSLADPPYEGPKP